MNCPHTNAQAKKYLGGEPYRYCPDCFTTMDGEEGEAKRELIAGACATDPGEEGE